ncbi:RING-type domain-containing protein [Durusdinium trenchii]|uniref:RING-type domain-containing protein n=1 Tax=Durusdinium trenchii TaxID=1381693 RepID=A0ABP0NIP5_9DINO
MATQPLMSAASAASAAVALDKEGYRELIRRGDQEQMVVFLRRLIAQHQLPEVSAEALERLARQHLKVPSSFQELLRELGSVSDGSCGDCCASSSSGPDAAQALRPGSTAPTVELPMDGRNWVAQAIAGPLALAHPPWWRRWSGGGGPAQLVLLSPDGGRGLVISSSPDEQQLREIARSIATQLGAGLSALQQPEVYEALRGDPTQLARLATAAGAVATEMQIPTAPPEEEVRPDEEHGDCPICLEPMNHGEAAMRCAGEGGVHHYFHARCLKTWVRSRSSQGHATCPMCRGQLQMNGQRLQEFLDGEQSSNLSEDDRTYLQTLADGLRGRNSWSSMNRVEKAAYAGGILAAAGWGFMLGYTEERHRASHVLVLDVLPAEHQLAQGVGWLIGLIASCIRKSLQDREREDQRRNRRNC